MNWIVLLMGAFCGGFIGAAFGAIPSFIVTGLIAVTGGILSIAGVSDFSVSYLAFGVLWGPHTAFAGAAAAAAFANLKRNKLDSAQNVLKPLYSVGDISTLICGGVFAMIGFAFYTLFITTLSFAKTDAPGAAVFFTLMVCRLVFGKTGPIGHCNSNETRSLLPDFNSSMLLHALLGGLFGLVIGIIGMAMSDGGMAPEQLAVYPVVCFGISAISLVFLQAGFGIPITHHISYPAAVAFVLTGNIAIAAAVGAINAVLWQIAGNVFNSHCDTYIDPPATVIMLSISLLNLIFA